MRCMTCTLQQECQRDSWTDVNKNEYKQCITVNSTKLLYTVYNKKQRNGGIYETDHQQFFHAANL